MATSNLKNNTALSRFEMIEGSHVVYADYGIEGNTLTIKYVFAPPELRGTGAAGRFMDALTNHAREQNYKIIPVCGYAATWIQRHPEAHDLLA